MKHWTEEEIENLKVKYSNELNKKLSRDLNKSVKAITWKAFELGLKKDYDFFCKSRKKYKKEFTKILFQRLYLEEKKSIREIAKILGLNKNTVDYYLKKYKIKTRNQIQARKIRVHKYPSWNKGLDKNDKRISEMANKIKKINVTKREERLKKIEEKYKKPIKEVINELYWNKDLTQEKISRQTGLSRHLIIKLMKDLMISKRPNYKYISELKGKNHPLYGKTWEEVYGANAAKEKKRKYSLKMRKNILRRLKNNEMPFSNTKIEKDMVNEINKIKIPFVAQYSVDKKFVCDIAIPNFNIIIECDGDYWHANPKLYDRNNLDLRQKRNVQRDKFKDLYLSKKGWKVFRFFESEINKSPKKCVDKVIKEIQKQLKDIKNPLDSL